MPIGSDLISRRPRWYCLGVLAQVSRNSPHHPGSGHTDSLPVIASNIKPNDWTQKGKSGPKARFVPKIRNSAPKRRRPTLTTATPQLSKIILPKLYEPADPYNSRDAYGAWSLVAMAAAWVGLTPMRVVCHKNISPHFNRGCTFGLTEASTSVSMIRGTRFLTPKLPFLDSLDPTHKLYEGRTSSWVGDYQRIPGVVWFFFFFHFWPHLLFERLGCQHGRHHAC